MLTTIIFKYSMGTFIKKNIYFTRSVEFRKCLLIEFNSPVIQPFMLLIYASERLHIFYRHLNSRVVPKINTA